MEGYPTVPYDQYNGGYPTHPAPATGGIGHISRKQQIVKAIDRIYGQKKVMSSPVQKKAAEQDIKALNAELKELRRQEKIYKTQSSISKTRERISRYNQPKEESFGLPSALQDPLGGSSRDTPALNYLNFGGSRGKKKSSKGSGLLGDDFNITL